MMINLQRYYLYHEARRWENVPAFADLNVKVDVSLRPDVDGWYRLTLTQDATEFCAATCLQYQTAQGRCRINDGGRWEIGDQANVITSPPILDLLQWEEA